MHANRLPVPALVRGALVLATGLALVLGGAVQPAAATSNAPVSVALGTHRFGHLRAPDSIVAHADPSAVGFFQPPEGQDGVAFGPWSFDVARDGSIWLLDEVKHRLLSWRAGQPDRPTGSVRLPQDPLERVADFAVAPDDSIYATYVPPPGPGPKTLRLAKLTADGRVLWTAATTVEIFNARLRIGPDDALYVAGGHDGTQDWTPLTTPAGRPLSLADQRRGTSAQQPLPGGLRLAATSPSGAERRFTLSDEGGRAGRAWRGSPARTAWVRRLRRPPWSAATRWSWSRSPGRPGPSFCTSTRSCGWPGLVGPACGLRSPPSRGWCTATPP